MSWNDRDKDSENVNVNSFLSIVFLAIAVAVPFTPYLTHIWRLVGKKSLPVTLLDAPVVIAKSPHYEIGSSLEYHVTIFKSRFFLRED